MTGEPGNLPDKARHVMLVLDPSSCGAEAPDPDDLHRVELIFEAAERSDLAYLTLLGGPAGPTNLIDYFKSVQQHIDIIDKSYTCDYLDQQDISMSSGAHLAVNMLASYSGKHDIVTSVKRVVRDVGGGVSGGGRMDHLEAEIGRGLRLGGLPEPDLIVFFDGGRRTGDAGVWMGAYSEFAFLEGPWPSFTSDNLSDLLVDFGLRERRFGAV